MTKTRGDNDWVKRSAQPLKMERIEAFFWRPWVYAASPRYVRHRTNAVGCSKLPVPQHQASQPAREKPSFCIRTKYMTVKPAPKRVFIIG